MEGKSITNSYGKKTMVNGVLLNGLPRSSNILHK